jgi:hypothetical protein
MLPGPRHPMYRPKCAVRHFLAKTTERLSDRLTAILIRSGWVRPLKSRDSVYVGTHGD